MCLYFRFPYCLLPTEPGRKSYEGRNYEQSKKQWKMVVLELILTFVRFHGKRSWAMQIGTWCAELRFPTTIATIQCVCRHHKLPRFQFSEQSDTSKHVYGSDTSCRVCARMWQICTHPAEFHHIRRQVDGLRYCISRIRRNFCHKVARSVFP